MPKLIIVDHHKILWILWCGLFVLSAYRAIVEMEESNSYRVFEFSPSLQQVDNDNAFFAREFVSIDNTTPSVHSATVAVVGKHELEVMWFAGAREGAKDVAIYGNRYNTQSKRWGHADIVLTRQTLIAQSGQYIKKLGNPVLYRDKNNRFHLFVVGASLGGWATSKIYHLTSTDDKQFKLNRVLPLSPLMNISHLVRTSPVTLSDGGFYLPIYQELANTFGLLLRFDSKGELVSMHKMNKQVNQLQPSIAIINKNECISAWRSKKSNQPMMLQYCHDGGHKWDTPIWSNIKNHNSSSIVFNAFGQIFLINNQAKYGNERYALNLFKLNGKNTFLHIAELDHSDNGGEVSYPTSVVIDGVVHIFYTYNREKIGHIQFNQAWIEQQ